MTDNEIIKALECCGGNSAIDCYDCPLQRGEITHCTTELATNALDLINRQKAEIVETRRDLLNEIYALEHQLETAKSEAYKEFAERLNEIHISPSLKATTDRLIKELSEVSDNA